MASESSLIKRQSLVWTARNPNGNETIESPYFSFMNLKWKLELSISSDEDRILEISLRNCDDVKAFQSFEVKTYLGNRRQNEQVLRSTLSISSIYEVLYREKYYKELYDDITVECLFNLSNAGLKLHQVVNESTLSLKIRHRLIWEVEKPECKSSIESPAFSLMNSRWKLCIKRHKFTIEIFLQNCSEMQLFQSFEVTTLLEDRRRDDLNILCSKLNVRNSCETLCGIGDCDLYKRLPGLQYYNDINIVCIFDQSTGLDFYASKKGSTLKIKNDFEELLESGKYSDVTIQVKHMEFHCHRCILGARSPVFSAMFYHDMKEKASCIVTIDADPVAFQKFLCFLYTGDEEHLKLEHVTELYELGRRYAANDLKELCVEQMKRNITTENFFECFLLSQEYPPDAELTNMCVQFFLEKKEEISKSEKWLSFKSERSDLYQVLIAALIKN